MYILTSVHTPYGMRPEVRGISHGRKSVPRTLFCSAFRFPYGEKEKRNTILTDGVSFLVTRTGIEPMLPP